jgi:hypothetical protein
VNGGVGTLSLPVFAKANQMTQLIRIIRNGPHGRAVRRTAYNLTPSAPTEDGLLETRRESYCGKKALAALGIGMIATGAALTIAFGTARQAHAGNTFGVARSAMSSPGGPR